MIVSAVFDNRKRTIPLDLDDVKLGRVWTKDGKDIYYLGQKQITKHELTNLLESIGIMKNYNYNIVKQG